MLRAWDTVSPDQFYNGADLGLPPMDASVVDQVIGAQPKRALKANDAGLLSAALGDIARVGGMTDIAKAAGITREALYKALRPDSAPRLTPSTVYAPTLAFALVVEPLRPV